MYNFNKLENTGSVNHLPRSESIPSQKRQDAKIVIEKLIKENPSLSISKLSVAAQISYGTTRTILLDDLGLKPYRRQIVHELVIMKKGSGLLIQVAFPYLIMTQILLFLAMKLGLNGPRQ